MAETGRLRLSAARPLGLPLRPVTALRIAIIVAVVVIWEAVSASGWLYRDVVPSLTAIGKALYATLADPSFYFHLGTTAYEIGIAMVIGGLSGLAVGILLGGSKFMSRAYEAYLYYLGPCPKIIFFPIMIMWFGVGPGSKVAMGAISDRGQQIHVARLRGLSLLPRSLPEDHLLPHHDHVVRRRTRIEGGDGGDLLLLSGCAQRRRRHARDRQGPHPRRQEFPRQHLADGDQDLPSS